MSCGHRKQGVFRFWECRRCRGCQECTKLQIMKNIANLARWHCFKLSDILTLHRDVAICLSITVLFYLVLPSNPDCTVVWVLSWVAQSLLYSCFQREHRVEWPNSGQNGTIFFFWNLFFWMSVSSMLIKMVLKVVKTSKLYFLYFIFVTPVPRF